MGHGHSNAHVELKNPGPFAVSGTVKSALVAFVVVGVLAFGAGLKANPERAWTSLLINHFYFLSLAVGGLVFAAIQFLTGAMWSAPVRRIAESYTAFLPWLVISMLGIFAGMGTLYHWTHADYVAGDLVLEGKKAYLNVPFFMIRAVVALAVWAVFAKLMVGNSLKQDTSKDPALTVKNKRLAPGFLILFAITFSVASFDLLMSLDPHWYSTMFGVYCFAGLLYTTFALTAIIAVYLKNKGHLLGLVNENHFHDLGKFMFGFSVFYAYIGFSQFMLIWYANLPEETGYFLRRMGEGWGAVSVFLLAGKWFLPFFVLLPRGNKRSTKVLTAVGLWMMVAHWIDLMWLVQPEFNAAGPQVGWIELGTTLGMLGLFGLAVTRFWAKNNMVAIGDPRLEKSVLHHHQ